MGTAGNGPSGSWARRARVGQRLQSWKGADPNSTVVRSNGPSVAGGSARTFASASAARAFTGVVRAQGSGPSSHTVAVYSASLR